MLANQPGKKLNHYVKDYVIYDLETTGTNSNRDGVVEISAVKVVDGLVVDEFTTLVNPEMPIPFAASDVNGITDEMVADAHVFKKALADFLDFAQDNVLVGHNIQAFDMKFLYRFAMEYWGQTVGNNYIDTLQIARAYLPQLEHHRLTDLAMFYDISPEGAHRALNDCRMNQAVFERLGQEMANPSVAVKFCPRCGSVMRKRSGRFGEFLGCSGYPECKYTENL